MSQETEPCVHDLCNCTVKNPVGTEGFCSETCRTAGESELAESCACGHPECDVV